MMNMPHFSAEQIGRMFVLASAIVRAFCSIPQSFGLVHLPPPPCSAIDKSHRDLDPLPFAAKNFFRCASAPAFTRSAVVFAFPSAAFLRRPSNGGPVRKIHAHGILRSPGYCRGRSVMSWIPRRPGGAIAALIPGASGADDLL